MNLQRNLVFVRHAQSIGNIMSSDERAQSDIPNHRYELTDIGRKQAWITGQYLKEIFGSKYFSYFFQSTFRRTEETMGIIQAELGNSTLPITDPRLDEKWDGIFHEFSKGEIELKYPDQIRLRKRSGYYHYRAPGGENGPDVELRIRGFINDFLLSYDHRNILIVGHGRWFLFFQRLVHNLSGDELMKLKEIEIPNCSVTTYRVIGPNEIPEIIVPWKDKIPNVPTELA